jgi:hypothetical protein
LTGIQLAQATPRPRGATQSTLVARARDALQNVPLVSDPNTSGLAVAARGSQAGLQSGGVPLNTAPPNSGAVPPINDPGIQPDWLDPISILINALKDGVGVTDLLPLQDWATQGAQQLLDGITNKFQQVLGPFNDPSTFTDPFVDGTPSSFPVGGDTSDPSDN